MADAVFEGGGIKGIGLVGAAAATEEFGYQWCHLAGTSAGAIVAALLAAGYTGGELAAILQKVDYRDFLDPTPVARIPVVGTALALLGGWGRYLGNAFHRWLQGLLAAKGVHTFGDLLAPPALLQPGETNDPRYRYRLRVVASDLTRGRMLVLPQDARGFGIDPDKLEVALAVRMSMAIPFFFRPVCIKPRGLGVVGGVPSVVVDGGLLSNYPVGLFDSPDSPAWPTFGFRLVGPTGGKPRRITGAASMLTAIIATMLEAHDARHIEAQDFVRTIRIPTLGVGTMEFDLSPARSQALFAAGREAAMAFFHRWDFPLYVGRYRWASGV